MTVVIDVGAARYGGDYSMERLIEQYDPTHLYAIDPNPALELPEFCEETKITLLRVAAWTDAGEIGYKADGLNSWVALDGPKVPCIDLADFVNEVVISHFSGERLILKLDCEGSEYDLLPHLMARQADELLDTVIVEWHPKTRSNADVLRQGIEQTIKCGEIVEWPY